MGRIDPDQARPAPDDLAEIRRLNRELLEMITPKVFEEARELLAKIAAVR